MNIIYVSTLCSLEKIKEIYKDNIYNLGQQAQKYHRLLVEGFILNKQDILLLSLPPINRKTSKKIFFKKSTEKNQKQKYYYLSVINIPIIKQIWSFLKSFTTTLRTAKKSSVIICDVLNISISMGALLAAKLKGIKNIGIVTDLPSYLYSKKSLVKKINSRLLNSFDSYVFLTEEMSKVVKCDKKDYVIIEGQVDINAESISNNLSNKYEKKVCLYAGGLREIYGLDYLVKGFLKAQINDAELHIYGSGEYVDKLLEICKEHDNVKYFGVKLNDVVVNEELKATLLVNPRPSNEEYTKYSFPSKNMEYMSSGTPVLTTKLPGMPQEYNEYVYLIEEETTDGIARELKTILSKTKEELHQKGLSAKNFVLEYKNNVIQTAKILEMINKRI